MSLILDALNRAESERKNQNAVPDLNTLHHPQAMHVESGGHRVLWLIISGVVVVAAVVVSVILWLRPAPVVIPVAPPASTTEAAVVTSPPIAQQAPNPVTVQPASAQSIAAAKTPAPSIGSEVQASKASTPISQPAVAANINQLYAAEEAAPSAAVDSGVNELYAAEAAIAAGSESIVDPFNAPVNTTQSINTAISVQEVAPPRTFDSIKNIPDFNALPWNMRQQIPTISYARHNYLAGGVSSVVINNQTTGVGNIIGTGQFIVQEIFVDGVVLKHGNAVFKLRALTGWINM